MTATAVRPAALIPTPRTAVSGWNQRDSCTTAGSISRLGRTIMTVGTPPSVSHWNSHPTLTCMW